MTDLENFPTDETAKDMMSMISPIYDRSYVGKWLFEVMGIQLGRAIGAIRKVFLEANIDTSEEMLMYWEQLYGVPTNLSLSLEERRRNIRRIRYDSHPMNPARIEQIIGDLTGRDVIVIENTAPHTYEVCIQDGDGDVDYDAVWQTIYDIKQSQKHVDIVFEIRTGIRIRADPEAYEFPYNMAGPSQKAGTWPDVNMPAKIADEAVVLDEDATHVAVPYISSGTRPETNIPGKIGEGTLEVDPESEAMKTGYVMTGTVPDINIPGAVTDGAVLLSPAEDRAQFQYAPASEKIKAGTIPEPDIIYRPVDPDILAGHYEDVGVFSYIPASENAIAGTFPEESIIYVPVDKTMLVGGDVTVNNFYYISPNDSKSTGVFPEISHTVRFVESNLEAGAATEGHPYSYVPAGTAPDVSIQGRAEDVSITPPTVLEKSTFSYTDAGEEIKAGTMPEPSIPAENTDQKLDVGERSGVPGIEEDVSGKSYGFTYSKCGQKKL